MEVGDVTDYAFVLEVLVEEAKDLKDVQWFGVQDPYVKLKLNDAAVKSKVCWDGGVHGVWEQLFTFYVHSVAGQKLYISVRNQNVFDRTIIGESFVPLDRFADGRLHSTWYSIFRRRKLTGRLKLTIHVKPNRLHSPRRAARRRRSSVVRAPPRIETTADESLSKLPAHVDDMDDEALGELGRDLFSAAFDDRGGRR
eukprot:PLAT9951.1.p2 GENE.PLAT9951.1~~PLAT9951.1.p2  ORF type:complete len:205 (-),score=68.36 PLAT9951.1:114-704(-)